MANETFAPFKYRTYRLLWIAALVSNLGGLIQGVAAGWLMTSLSTSPFMVSLVQGSTTLPLAILSLLGGVFADNFERRTVMILSHMFMFVVSLSLAILAAAGALGPWGLLCFTFAIGAGAAMNLPSWQASVGDLVPREHLPQAVMLNGMGFNLMRSAGPAIGGLIVAAFGAAVAFAINAITYLPVLLVLRSWRPNRVPDPLPREPLVTALSAGMRYVSFSPSHLRILGRGAAFGFAAVSVLALMPLVARELLQGTAITFGAMLACFGMGAVLSALSLRRVRDRYDNESIVRVAFLIMAVALLIMGQSRTVWLTGVVSFAAGIAWQSSMALFNVSVQLSTPRWVLGRAMSLLQVFTFSGMTLGSYVWGRIATTADVETALSAAALASLLGASLGLLLRLPVEEQDDLNPHGGFIPPVPALDITQQSGPIKVSVSYSVPEEKTDAFLKLMAERRIIRLRDGAVGWALYRDLQEPSSWHESYRAPTWAAYLRHMNRRTARDAENFNALRTLLGESARPTAHRWIERPTDTRHMHSNR